MIRHNILLEPLPKSVEISGRKYAINTDYRVGFRLEEIMRSSLTGEAKVKEILEAYYPVIPANVQEALNKAIWFYQCGDVQQEKKDNKRERYRSMRQRNVVAYSFCQDAPYLYAAFLEQYNIDLCDIKYMHWWKFCAMFESLSDDTQMSKIMYYRKVSTSGMPKEKRFFINEMKKRYQLIDDTSLTGRITLEQRNMRWRNYVKDRYEEQESGKN